MITMMMRRSLRTKASNLTVNMNMTTNDQVDSGDDRVRK
jgi:hypothetical protein